jgi:hypothetical protein
MTDKAETLHVQDINHFIQLLSAWHQNKVKTLEHMLTVPEGTEVTFNDEGPQILTGDMLKGFVIGLSLGLMELGHLPFAAEIEDDSPAFSNEPVH